MTYTLIKTAGLAIIAVLSISNIAIAKLEAREKEPVITINGYTFKDMNKNGKLDPWEDTRLSEQQRIDAIVKEMTNSEKADLLIGIGMSGIEVVTGPIGDSKDGPVPGAAGGTAAYERFGIPETVIADGPAGLRINPSRENDPKKYYATAFPVGTALASSWNLSLLEEVGQAYIHPRVMIY